MSQGRGKSQRNLDLIGAAVRILEKIAPASVRAVCYRLFVEKLIGGMEVEHTRRVSKQLVDAREEGTVPWVWIVDASRETDYGATRWANPEQRFAAAAKSYRRDNWQDQPKRVELWSEKATVAGTLSPVLDEFGVPFTIMHGRSSASAVKLAADRSTHEDRPLVVLYVGDCDPSGMSMSVRDLPERIRRYGGNIELVRIAIIDRDKTLPWFPAADKGPRGEKGTPGYKKGDPSYEWYVARYGTKCWELDAMSPPDLRARVKGAILEHLDIEAWNRALAFEEVERKSVAEYAKGYKSICAQVQKYPPKP